MLSQSTYTNNTTFLIGCGVICPVCQLLGLITVARGAFVVGDAVGAIAVTLEREESE